MLDDKKKDLHGFEKPNLSLEPTLSDPIDNPISDPLNGPLHNASATATATPEADTETTLKANKEFSVSEKSLIIATLVISIIFFFIFLNHAASEDTTFGNKKVIGGLTIYITILFIGVDLLPSTSSRKKWYSIACRALTVMAILFSLTFFR